jgi:sulfotransferase family protein
MRHRTSESAPVLLGGENRSGTTLISVVLDSHPDLAIGPELDFLEPPNLGPHIAEVCDLLSAGDPRVLGSGTDTEDPYWYHGAHFAKQCQRFGVDFAVLQDLVRATVAQTGTDLMSFEDRCHLIDVIGDYRLSRDGVRRWGIKLQRKINRVDEFARYWPSAHFVHIVRDGRDLAASHLVTVPWGFTTAAEAPVGRYLEVRYEDLVTDPETTLRPVLDFLGLPWCDSVLAHWHVPHTLFDAPWGHPAADAAARPLSTGRVGRFREDLTPRQIADFEEIAAEQLLRLGYELDREGLDAATRS